jgi:putative transposase
VGSIEGQWFEEQQKLDILLMIDEAKEKGIALRRSCALLRINLRRVKRWRKRRKEHEGLSNLKPGPKRPLHTLLPMERTAVLEMAKREEYADLGHRILTVMAWDLEVCFLSFSSVYRILRAANCISMRGAQRHHTGRSLAPVRKALTGPNQRWCWDMSYLLTYEKGMYLYLYLLLDEYSRKAINWLISWHQTAHESQDLLEGGLISENILDLPEDQRPEIINDRGRQMKAKSIRRMFEEHHMPQLFARPRTPNDNPFVESLFGTVKTAPAYPGRFLDRHQAVEYFDRYLPWYNTEHLHSGIDYVTPEQCHRGLRETIVTERKAKLHKQRLLRKEVNRSKQNPLTDDLITLIVNPNQVMTCSVMNL